MCEERPCMAGVAVDRYGFIYDRLTPPATDDDVSVAHLVETNVSSVHLARGSVGDTYVPLLLIPLLTASQREA